MSNNAVKPAATLQDSHDRKIRYLRISITDRCNLHCLYCRGKEMSHIPHDKILRYEEFLRLASIMRNLGASKIRVTGGEPFARKDCLDFLRSLRKAWPELRLCATTNGTLLEPYIEDLAALNLSSLNISLDTLDETRFTEITGSPLLPVVLANIEKLLAKGLRVKINAVALRGITDAALPDFIHMVKTMPVEARFIEFMPMGAETTWSKSRFLSISELMSQAQSLATLEKLPAEDPLSGPAQMFGLPGAPGKLGFISAVSSHFCNSCNRLRITSVGNLRLCLFQDKELPLAPLLRTKGVTDEEISEKIRNAVWNKPLGNSLLTAKTSIAVVKTPMVGIGG